MKKVVVGIIGSGFAADLHACAYQKVYGVEVVMKAVASLAPNAGEFAAAHGIAEVYTDYREMLKDPEIDVVDVIAPTDGKAMRPISVGLAFFIDEMGVHWGPLMAASILMSIPAVIFFSLAQNQMVRGLSAGAVKG